MREQELSTLKESAVCASVQWAKTGLGYFTMRDKVNEYLEASGVNNAICDDQEAILYGRRAAALAVNIASIRFLTKSEEKKLNAALTSIAEDLPQTRHRGFHR